METLTIKIKDSKALKLIYDLEDLDLIQVMKPNVQETTVKLSELLKGSITSEEADEMHHQLKQMRGK